MREWEINEILWWFIWSLRWNGRIDIGTSTITKHRTNTNWWYLSSSNTSTTIISMLDIWYFVYDMMIENVIWFFIIYLFIRKWFEACSWFKKWMILGRCTAINILKKWLAHNSHSQSFQSLQSLHSHNYHILISGTVTRPVLARYIFVCAQYHLLFGYKASFTLVDDTINIYTRHNKNCNKQLHLVLLLNKPQYIFSFLVTN